MCGVTGRIGIRESLDVSISVFAGGNESKIGASAIEFVLVDVVDYFLRLPEAEHDESVEIESRSGLFGSNVATDIAVFVESPSVLLDGQGVR